MLPNWRRRLGQFSLTYRQRVEKPLPGRRDLRQQVLDKMTPADNPVAPSEDILFANGDISRRHPFADRFFSRNNGKI